MTLQSRLARRVLVVLFAASMLLMVWEWNQSWMPPREAWRSFMAAFIMQSGPFISLLSFMLLGVATSWQAFRHGSALDERQLKQRNAAMHHAYRLTTVAFVLFCAFALQGQWFPIFHLSGDWFVFHFIWVFGVLIALPTLMIAWLEPDPLPDEPGTHSAKQLG